MPVNEQQTGLPNIFMIHGAGGDAATFEPLGRHLAGRYNVWGIQAAGYDGVSPFHDSQEAMASSYLTEIRQVQSAGPYLLSGFSTGGVIAAELMRRTQAAGDTVERLILIDAFLPSLRPRSIPASEHLRNLVRAGPGYGLSRLRNRIQDRRMAKVTENAQLAGSVQVEVQRRKLVDHLVYLWADYEVGQVEVPVIMMSSEEIFDIWEGVIDDARGWESVAQDLRVVKVPGNHLDLLDESHAAVFAQRLFDALGD